MPKSKPRTMLDFAIARQPDDITCGPTALHALYDYYSDPVPLAQVVKEVQMLRGGGTLGSLLGSHALKRGYSVWIYTYNLRIFDPTWAELTAPAMVKKLSAQMEFKRTPKFQVASKAYVDFLTNGGQVKIHDLTTSLISDYLLQGIPLIVGLSATWLYKSTREYGKYPKPDDIRGMPAGHFVVLTSYDPTENAVTVADPYHPESMDGGHTYKITMEHLICAIMLGVVTYDGNLLVITKKK